MIWKRDIADDLGTTVKKHLKRNNGVLYVGTSTPIDIQPSKSINLLDVGFYLEQTFFERLHNVFVKAPKAFWREISCMSWRYPFGGKEEKDFWKTFGIEDKEDNKITVLHRAWWKYLRAGFVDAFFWIKQAFCRYSWVDWVLTFYTQEYESLPMDSWEDEVPDKDPKDWWFNFYDIPAFTSNDQICDAVKNFFKQKGLEVDVRYKDWSFATTDLSDFN